MATIPQIPQFDTLIDARTPAEYAEDHIAGAVNLPALTNTERARVGTLHREDPFAARRLGATLFTKNLTTHLGTTLSQHPPSWTPLVYCARGGQRSGGMVEIMRRIGWRADQLQGGYKAYRAHVITATQAMAGTLNWIVIAGKTGTGKTRLLAALKEQGAQVLDLEAAANHRGSAFGAVGPQPTQRAFESRLYTAIATYTREAPIYTEAESRKIGVLHIPSPILSALRRAPALHLQAHISDRVTHILDQYHPYRDPNLFGAAIKKLTPHTGEKRATKWRQMQESGDWRRLVEELLNDFYDIGYEKSLTKNYPSSKTHPSILINPNNPTTITQAALQTLNTPIP